MASTNNSPAVALTRKRILSEIKTLTAAVKDDNALMAGNEILASMQRLETLRAEYSVEAQMAHDEWCARNL